ncbi:hypothetical protein [Microcoleus sp. FACHB-672]|uniref:hypothetical protein n=1 Tax=Microcoleus sp. FACHB-672 TaxID=2692825 RepID=UPI00168281CF|nr:hypothetical protein [Microcoleus sp. FACHB-672]MBD2040506.1 hypothetical protein [Microcoleus sp. FACHB-672]
MTKAHSQTLWQDVVNSLKTTAAAIKRWVLLCLNLRVVICTPVPLLSHRLFLRNAGFFGLDTREMLALQALGFIRLVARMARKAPFRLIGFKKI